MQKIRILFLAASPAVAPLQLDEEIRAITAQVRAAEFRDAVEIVSRWALRADDLQQALLEVKPHVLHFSGHGTEKEEIVLLDDHGQAKPVAKAALVGLLRTLKDNLRVVVLNACFSRPQAEAITQSIDCAIGMNRAVGDLAAVQFAAAFYRGLGFGRSVQTAFDLGTNSLQMEGISEENTPQLLARAGVNPAELVLIPNTSSPAPSKTASPVQPSGTARPGGAALSIWREKLAYLQEQEAVTADPTQKFALRRQVEEAKAKIAELGG